MTSVFSWQNSVSLCPASLCTLKAKFACYSRYLLTSYFCIPVPYNEKNIFLGCQFQKVLQVLIEPFNFSFFSVQTWIAAILNGLPWKRTEIILSFLRLHPSTAFQSLLLTEGYSISSKGFLPTVVDIMVISIKFTDSSPFQFTDF